MPVPSLTLAPLPVAATHVVPVQPRFLQSLSDTLGDHLTSADGFDQLLNTPLSLIDPEAASVDSLGALAPDVASPAGTFTTDGLSAIAHDVATFNTGGDTILGVVGETVAPPPTPTVAPPPVHEPSGGGGGGGHEPFSNQGGGGETFVDPSGDWANFWKGVK